MPLDESPEGEAGVSLERILPDHRPSPREEISKEEEIQLVRRALTTLRPHDFQILVLREFEELSYEEIAQRLKIAIGTVMSHLHRARQALASRLKHLGLK